MKKKRKTATKKKGVLYIHGEKRFLTLSFFFTAVVELNRKQKKG
jgi:hypothetical protein